MTSVQSRAAEPARSAADQSTDDQTVEQTTCCIVGGGPGGMFLALLLARQGIPVTLLESHLDFDRDFRGDTVHSSTMELLDELGLAERVLALPHSEIHTATIPTTQGPFKALNFSQLHTKFPFITMLPQVHLLNFLASELRRYPNARLHMGARVEELITERGTIRGVRYRADDGWHAVRAVLTVGADGRFSRLRHLLGLEPIKTSPPMDVVWFRVPRHADDPEDVFVRIGAGHIYGFFNRGNVWQVGLIIAKGTFNQIKAEGLPAFRAHVAALVPEFADRVDTLSDWHQITLLSVESSRVQRWWRPGMLLIGDAAHVMSPVGGVGINYAIQDAVVAANLLSPSLRRNWLDLNALAGVQRQREWQIRIIQALQAIAQRVALGALGEGKAIDIPWPMRMFMHIPLVGDLPARVIAFGIWPVHLKGTRDSSIA